MARRTWIRYLAWSNRAYLRWKNPWVNCSTWNRCFQVLITVRFCDTVKCLQQKARQNQWKPEQTEWPGILDTANSEGLGLKTIEQNAFLQWKVRQNQWKPKQMEWPGILDLGNSEPEGLGLRMIEQVAIFATESKLKTVKSWANGMMKDIGFGKQWGPGSEDNRTNCKH